MKSCVNNNMFSAHNKPSINDDYIISRVSSRGSLAAQSVFAKAATESFRSHLNIFPSKSSDESIDTSCFCKSHRLVDRSCYLGCVNMTHPSITLPRQVEWGDGEGGCCGIEGEWETCLTLFTAPAGTFSHIMRSLSQYQGAESKAKLLGLP